MEKEQVGKLFQEFTHVKTIWTCGKSYFLQNPEIDGVKLVGLRDWKRSDFEKTKPVKTEE